MSEGKQNSADHPLMNGLGSAIIKNIVIAALVGGVGYLFNTVTQLETNVTVLQGQIVEYKVALKEHETHPQKHEFGFQLTSERITDLEQRLHNFDRRAENGRDNIYLDLEKRIDEIRTTHTQDYIRLVREVNE